VDARPSVAETFAGSVDFNADADQFHPTESVYHDPIFGEIRGREAIRTWLVDIMGKVGNMTFEPLGPMLDDGITSVQEWQQMAIQPDGARAFMTRGTSVRRRGADGSIAYAADYFDTASLLDPDVQTAAIAAGSTVSADDIARYRTIA